MQLPIILISLMAKNLLRDRPGSWGTSPRPVILTLRPVSPESSKGDTVNQIVHPVIGPCPGGQTYTFNLPALWHTDVRVLTERVELHLCKMMMLLMFYKHRFWKFNRLRLLSTTTEEFTVTHFNARSQIIKSNAKSIKIK